MKKWRKKGVIVLGIIAIIAVAQFISVQMALSYERPVSDEPMMCAQYGVSAINVFTGAVHGFPEPCDVPPGWVIIGH